MLYGSADKREARGGFLPGLTELGEASLAGRDVPFVRNSEGLKWASPKSDRLNITSGSVTTRYTVNEQVDQRVVTAPLVIFSRSPLGEAHFRPSLLRMKGTSRPARLASPSSVRPGQEAAAALALVGRAVEHDENRNGADGAGKTGADQPAEAADLGGFRRDRSRTDP